MPHRAWLLSLLLLLVATVASADPGTIYKWTDKEGNVHYTDCPPPPGCKTETVEAQATPSAAEVEQARQRLEKLLAEQERSAAVREEERLERERRQALAMELAAVQKRMCIQAQQNLHVLLMERPVYYINEKGERVFLDDATHKAEIERMRKMIEEYCPPRAGRE
jgi:CBS-domain-containing membrane protein